MRGVLLIIPRPAPSIACMSDLEMFVKVWDILEVKEQGKK